MSLGTLSRPLTWGMTCAKQSEGVAHPSASLSPGQTVCATQITPAWHTPGWHSQIINPQQGKTGVPEAVCHPYRYDIRVNHPDLAHPSFRCDGPAVFAHVGLLARHPNVARRFLHASSPHPGNKSGARRKEMTCSPDMDDLEMGGNFEESYAQQRIRWRNEARARADA